MKYCLLLLLVFTSLGLKAQVDTDMQLAQHYYASGDFEKAKIYYVKLYDKDPSKFNFLRYYDCLIQTNDKKEAEKVLKEIQRLNPQWQRRYRPTLEELRIKK